MAMLHMANDSGLFRLSDEGDVQLLYEAKLIHIFDHRLSSYDKRPEGSQDTELPRLDLNEKDDPWRSPTPRYWIERAEVDKRLARRNWDKGWLLGWRDICRSTDERTVISAIIPRSGVGDKYLLAFTEEGAHLLQANLSSFVLDYVARQKFAGTSLKYYLIKQLPVLPPAAYQAWADWIRDRVLELTFTAWDIEAFARDFGDAGPPFHWDEARRFAMRAELDALFFHLYEMDRDDVAYIMETFPIVKRKDVAQHGTFRTKDMILEIYDAMAEASRTGRPYQTILDPAPGKGPRHG
jgi:hypothetical protein